MWCKLHGAICVGRPTSCNTCGAIYVVQYMLCKLYGGTQVVQTAWCNICGVSYVDEVYVITYIDVATAMRCNLYGVHFAVSDHGTAMRIQSNATKCITMHSHTQQQGDEEAANWRQGHSRHANTQAQTTGGGAATATT